MTPLSNLDSLFLHLETKNTPMHIGSLSIYDQSKTPEGRLRFTDILKFYRSRLDRAKVFQIALAALLILLIAESILAWQFGRARLKTSV